jgi:hypothetical protein
MGLKQSRGFPLFKRQGRTLSRRTARKSVLCQGGFFVSACDLRIAFWPQSAVLECPLSRRCWA